MSTVSSQLRSIADLFLPLVNKSITFDECTKYITDAIVDCSIAHAESIVSFNQLPLSQGMYCLLLLV